MRCVLRREGMSVAIDDAGAGYASMSHMLNLERDYIEAWTSSLTRNINSRSQALRTFAGPRLIEFEGGRAVAKIVAEGVRGE